MFDERKIEERDRLRKGKTIIEELLEKLEEIIRKRGDHVTGWETRPSQIAGTDKIIPSTYEEKKEHA